MSRISFQFPAHLAEQVRAHAARLDRSVGWILTFCKVTPRAVRNWLSGRPPSPTVFALISSAWGEDTFLYLIGDINRMPEPQPEPVRVAKEG